MAVDYNKLLYTDTNVAELDSSLFGGSPSQHAEELTCLDSPIIEVEVKKPAALAQCRPIPLYNVIYKVIAKVAVSRLRPLLEKLLSPNQNSFIPGRGTT